MIYFRAAFTGDMYAVVFFYLSLQNDGLLQTKLMLVLMLLLSTRALLSIFLFTNVNRINRGRVWEFRNIRGHVNTRNLGLTCCYRKDTLFCKDLVLKRMSTAFHLFLHAQMIQFSIHYDPETLRGNIFFYEKNEKANK